jgi:hypothetical protein
VLQYLSGRIATGSSNVSIVAVLLGRAINVNSTPGFHWFSIKRLRISRTDIAFLVSGDTSQETAREVAMKKLMIEGQECWRSVIRISDEHDNQDTTGVHPYCADHVVKPNSQF